MTSNLKNKKILIIGLGSSGSRYLNILKNMKFKNIFTFSKIKIRNINALKSYQEIINIDPDYILICTETSNHFEQLKKINRLFKNKRILVEKPLFHKNLKIKNIKNKIFIGYNLRFHPVFNFLQKKINKNLNNFFDLNLSCNSYLPNWRKRDYKKSYSAHRSLGGGVINDLSHEIDMALKLVGKIEIQNSYLSKLSGLKINSEDNFFAICKKKNNQKITIDLNYYSLIDLRTIKFTSSTLGIQADFIKNEIIINKKNKIKKIKFNNKFNTYESLIRDFLFNNGRNCASYYEGLRVNKFIEKAKTI